MKYIKVLFLSLTVSALMLACNSASHDHDGHDHDASHQEEAAAPAEGPHGATAEFTSPYVCPMHCEGGGSDHPGKCPACEMDYVTNAEHVKDGHTH